MKPSLKLAIPALAGLCAALLGNGEAAAGQFKTLSSPVPNASCVFMYSTPTNQSTAMGMEIYEFVTPAADNYRCCITANTTGQDLVVRVLGLTGAPLASAITPVNGTICTPYVGLTAPFAFQCNVSGGGGSPVLANSYYRIAVCRQ